MFTELWPNLNYLLIFSLHFIQYIKVKDNIILVDNIKVKTIWNEILNCYMLNTILIFVYDHIGQSNTSKITKNQFKIFEYPDGKMADYIVYSLDDVS